MRIEAGAKAHGNSDFFGGAWIFRHNAPHAPRMSKGFHKARFLHLLKNSLVDTGVRCGSCAVGRTDFRSAPSLRTTLVVFGAMTAIRIAASPAANASCRMWASRDLSRSGRGGKFAQKSFPLPKKLRELEYRYVNSPEARRVFFWSFL